MLRFALYLGLLMLAGCEKPQDIREFATREVTMPDGTAIRVEALRDPMDMMRGAMFRTSLPPDRGFLYEYAKPGNYGFWMYRTEIPLDTIWMDRNRKVVEIVKSMPPCPSKSAKECPHFGGRFVSQYVLQVAAGLADKYSVREGSVLNF